MQEYMCDFLDTSLSLISSESIMKVTQNNKDMHNYADEVDSNIDFIYKSPNPVWIGVDVARKRDFTSIIAYEELENDGMSFFKQVMMSWYSCV